MCLRRPPPTTNIVHCECPKGSPKHKKKVSEDLRVALDNYREINPDILIIDSPNYGLEKRKLTFSLRTWGY